jgi:hypothetical protein
MEMEKNGGKWVGDWMMDKGDGFEDKTMMCSVDFVKSGPGHVSAWAELFLVGQSLKKSILPGEKPPPLRRRAGESAEN